MSDDNGVYKTVIVNISQFDGFEKTLRAILVGFFRAHLITLVQLCCVRLVHDKDG